MAILPFRPLPMQLALLLAVFQTCQATITAWVTGIGPQIMLQNTTTTDIRYSYCNSFNSPIYNTTEDTSFSSPTLPRMAPLWLASDGGPTPSLCKFILRTDEERAGVL